MVRLPSFLIEQDTDSSRTVWCWGWDGAGDLDGPDVDPIWEKMSNISTRPESVTVKHDRSIILESGVGLGI
jgi:alpha-1,3-mannosyltransferase